MSTLAACRVALATTQACLDNARASCDQLSRLLAEVRVDAGEDRAELTKLLADVRAVLLSADAPSPGKRMIIVDATELEHLASRCERALVVRS